MRTPQSSRPAHIALAAAALTILIGLLGGTALRNRSETAAPDTSTTTPSTLTPGTKVGGTPNTLVNTPGSTLPPGVGTTTPQTLPDVAPTPPSDGTDPGRGPITPSTQLPDDKNSDGNHGDTSFTDKENPLGSPDGSKGQALTNGEQTTWFYTVNKTQDEVRDFYLIQLASKGYTIDGIYAYGDPAGVHDTGIKAHKGTDIVTIRLHPTAKTTTEIDLQIGPLGDGGEA